MISHRDDELTAGTDANLAALKQLLDPWACCNKPATCGTICEHNDLAYTLSMAAYVVTRVIQRRYTAATDYKAPQKRANPGRQTPESTIRQAVQRYEQAMRELEQQLDDDEEEEDQP